MFKSMFTKISASKLQDGEKMPNVFIALYHIKCALFRTKEKNTATLMSPIFPLDFQWHFYNNCEIFKKLWAIYVLM